MKKNQIRFMFKLKRYLVNFLIILLLGFNLSASHAQSCGTGTNLIANQWTMISLPCAPTSNTVQDVFGDDLGDANYNVRWIVYERNESTDTYLPLTLSSTLNQGESYWIISLDNAMVDVTGTATPLTTGNANCPSPAGCFEVTLTPPDINTATRQNMVGHPFPFDVDWADVVVEVNGVPYPPSGAELFDFVSKTIHKYNGGSYDPFDDVTPAMEGVLNAYDGIWVETLGSSAGLTVKLLIGDPNQPPTANNDSYSFLADADQTIAAGAGLFADNGSGADALGSPAATLVNFGGGSLGGVVTANAAGASVALAGGTLTVNADASWSLTGQPFTPGTYTFNYLLDNGVGTSTATVTLMITAAASCNNDSYTATGNVGIDSTNGTNQSVLFNDMGMPLTVTAFDDTSNNSTTPNVNVVLATGEFTYNPPAGFTGADSFTYTANTTLTCTVNITVSNRIWFIDNSGANGDGRLGSPFSSIANFNSNATDAAGDSIFLDSGSGNYTGPLTLLNNQKLIGQGATDTVTNISGIMFAPLSDTLPTTSGTRPVIANNFNNLTLGQNNTVRGLDLSNAGGTGLIGSNFGNLTLSEVSVSNTSGTAINLNTGNPTASFTSVSSTAGANGIILNSTTGSFSVTGSGSTNGSGGNIQGNATGVSLTSASNVSLKNMNFPGTHSDFVIRGASVNNLTLNNIRVTGTSGDSVIADEGGILLTGITGNLDVDGGVYGGGIEDNFAVNNSSGTVNATFDNVTFNANNTSTGDNNLQFRTSSSATGNLSINGSTFNGGRSVMSFTDIAGSGGGTINIGGTSANMFLQGQTNVPGGGAIEVLASGNNTVNTTVSNNTIRANGSTFEGDVIVLGTTSGFAGTHNLTLDNNTIGISGSNGSAVNPSAGFGDTGIVISSNGNGTLNALLNNNKIFDYNASGIDIIYDAEGPNDPTGGAVNLTITNNNISDVVGVSGFGGGSISVLGGGSSPGDDVDVCFDVRTNTLNNPAGFEILLDIIASGSPTFALPGLVTLTDPGVASLLASNNSLLTSDIDVFTSGLSFSGTGSVPPPPVGGSCVQP